MKPLNAPDTDLSAVSTAMIAPWATTKAAASCLMLPVAFW